MLLVYVKHTAPRLTAWALFYAAARMPARIRNAAQAAAQRPIYTKTAPETGPFFYAFLLWGLWRPAGRFLRLGI